ncbi:hypothetical protein ILYODFUR_017799 [Ilyodon furcidens]|uniref:Uncharacterized protein n=1 Tax=Ilyodon furcidens TaxID=33524 RepID=A0ABV0V3W6_9TELE
MGEIRATDIQRPSRAQEPQENYRWDYRNTPREEQGRVPGEPPSSHSAKDPWNCSNERTGPASSRLRKSRSSHGPRDPRPQNTSLPKQRPDRAQAPRPQQAATGSEPAHIKASNSGHREPQVHQWAETLATSRWCGGGEIGPTFEAGLKMIQEWELPKG